MALYPCWPNNDHAFPLHIRMQLVLEIDLVLNMKGRKNVEKLCGCQNNWNRTKLTFIKTWEIKLLDSQSGILGLLLRDAMMSIHYPTNGKFALFHSINKSWRETCYILTVWNWLSHLLMPWSWHYFPICNGRSARKKGIRQAHLLLNGSNQQLTLVLLMLTGICVKNASRMLVTEC